MAIENYMRDTVGSEDVPFIDALTEEAPLLEALPMQTTNKGMQHNFEKLKSVSAIQLVDLDGALPIIGSDSTMDDVTLSVLGGQMTVGEDAANKFGGVAQYFAKKIKPVLVETGSQLEASLIYNTWRPAAKANNREIDAGGSGSAIMYSILAVKFVEDESFGLFDPNGFGTGKMFDIAPLNNGSLHNVDVGGGVEAPGYAQRAKAYFGIQTSNERNIGSIVNIDLTPDGGTDSGFKDFPTEAQMDDLLEHVRANSSNTRLMMHPKVANALAVYKAGRLELGVEDENLKRRFKLWEGIEINQSRNFKNGTEAVVV